MENQIFTICFLPPQRFSFVSRSVFHARFPLFSEKEPLPPSTGPRAQKSVPRQHLPATSGQFLCRIDKNGGRIPRGFWLKHPAQNNLAPLPAAEKVKIISDFVNRPQIEISKIKDYSEWLRVQYGNYFAENFPFKYTRKYWGVEPEILETKWVGNRMHSPSLDEILKGAFEEQKENFYYARYGETGFEWFMSRYLPWGEHVVKPNTLWKEYTYPSEPKEIPFFEWLQGFLKKYCGGTVEECREAVERQKPKKPDYEGDGYADGYMVYDTWICPNCGEKYEVDYDNYGHCPKCGQEIDWEESEG